MRIPDSDGPRSLLDPAVAARLRTALQRSFDTDALTTSLGPIGERALARGDLSYIERLTREPGDTSTLIRLFLLGRAVSRAACVRALAPFTVIEGIDAGLLEEAGDRIRAAYDIRPYSEAGADTWWVLSDLGADVRPGPLRPDHVLGIGPAALSLAQATVRVAARDALDLGTGSGVQALHLSRHCARVTVTDVNPRALRLAATTAAVNGLTWDLRLGSLLEPVCQDEFDLIVSNPPFVVGPGPSAEGDTLIYRDSGFVGDEVSRRLLRQLPARLRAGGFAQVLANWSITSAEDSQHRLSSWLAGAGCDAWVWQREVAEPSEYVSLWLRDAGESPGSPSWRARYDTWLDWFDHAGVIGVGMGLVSLRRTESSSTRIVVEDVRQPVAAPAGAEIRGWFERQDWLRQTGTAALFGQYLVPAAGLLYEQQSTLPVEPEADPGWLAGFGSLRQPDGMRWTVEADSAVAGLVAACHAGVPIGTAASLVAGLLGADAGAVWDELVPIVCDLVGRGILLPAPERRV